MKKDNSAQDKTLLIAAGGTGGHITPGISIAEAWLSMGGRVVLATLMKNIEYPDILRLGRSRDGRGSDQVSVVAYDAPRLTKNPLKLFDFLRRFFSAYSLVKRAAQTENVDAVVGMGGYSSFPAVLWAILKRRPLFLCEQNARWGIVTRIGKFFARKIFLAFPEQKPLTQKFIVTGNPLRAMFEDQKRRATRVSAKGKKQILFIGGSQGATDINALYLNFITTKDAKNYICTVATGTAAFEALRQKARPGDKILPFIENMPAAYTATDFIVARCGSGTLFEILWAQKPAFLIPYPFAAADHQKANAEAMLPQMPCRIFDMRPFDKHKALADFLLFLKEPPTTQIHPPDTRAEIKISRYIKESLDHVQKT